MKKAKGTLLLLLAALIWGMAFVAQTSAADKIRAFTFNASRSIIAALFLLAIIGIRKMSGKAPVKAGKKQLQSIWQLAEHFAESPCLLQ